MGSSTRMLLKPVLIAMVLARPNANINLVVLPVILDMHLILLRISVSHNVIKIRPFLRGTSIIIFHFVETPYIMWILHQQASLS